MQPSNDPSIAREAELDTILAELMERLDRGERVDREAVLAAHVDLSDALRAYFEAADAVQRLAGNAPPLPKDAADSRS